MKVPPSRGRLHASVFDAKTLAEGAQRFLVRRETASRLLREAELAVHRDLKHSTTGLVQRHLRVRMGVENQVPHPTGAWLIASLSAIFDLDLHAVGLPIDGYRGQRGRLGHASASIDRDQGTWGRYGLDGGTLRGNV